MPATADRIPPPLSANAFRSPLVSRPTLRCVWSGTFNRMESAASWEFRRILPPSEREHGGRHPQPVHKARRMLLRIVTHSKRNVLGPRDRLPNEVRRHGWQNPPHRRKRASLAGRPCLFPRLSTKTAPHQRAVLYLSVWCIEWPVKGLLKAPLREQNLKAGDRICVDASLPGTSIELSFPKLPQQ